LLCRLSLVSTWNFHYSNNVFFGIILALIPWLTCTEDMVLVASAMVASAMVALAMEALAVALALAADVSVKCEQVCYFSYKIFKF
jgi:hypothetical protein